MTPSFEFGPRRRAPAEPPSAAARRRSCREALVASGVAPVPTLSTLDVARLGLGERFFYDEVLKAGYADVGGDGWPCEQTALDLDRSVFRDGHHCAVYRYPSGALAIAELHGGWFRVTAAAPSHDQVAAVCQAFRAGYPASYLTASEDPTVPITFWTMGQLGPVSRLRRIDASPWEPIRRNYTAAVQAEMDAMTAWTSGPGRDGQLLLWQGPPGTGKTWALRALASEWAPWAEFHYITDPDAFFVDRPAYMIDVLLADSYEVITPEGDVYEEQKLESKWRVLILEDTGELLAADAKEKYGQGLSRLLNVVDGMIGQGLRVLALVTTNDELESLNPATTRPGRCLSRAADGVGPTVFGPLSAEEAQAWSGAPDAEGGSLAELYARYAAGTDALEEDVRAEVARVAAAHQPDEPAYGQTAWDAETRSVLWVGWDGTGTDEAAAAEAAFLAVPGVERFAWEAEALPDGWWQAEVVYPENPPAWVVDRELAALVAAAREPFPTGRDAPPITAPPPEPAALEPAAADPAAGEALAMRALDVAAEYARRAEAEQPAPTFHIHLPAHALDVSVQTPPVTVEAARAPSVEVHLPEQAPPVVHVEAAASPDVTVNVPEQPAPVIDVHVPPAAPSPVHVQVESARPRAVRVEVDRQGGKTYVPVMDDEE